MKILVRNSDQAVIYADAMLMLDSTGCRGRGWVDARLTTDNATLQEAELPAHWTGAAWGYNGSWFVIDQPYVDQIMAAAEAEKTRLKREAAKAIRTNVVGRIQITTSSGKVFDGDEASQGRMARGILGLQAAGATSVTWVLADNTPTTVTVEELGEALALAGAAQAAVWVIA